jgi:hypothetical protein
LWIKRWVLKYCSQSPQNHSLQDKKLEREREREREKETKREERERVQEGTTFSCPRPKLKTEKI